MIKQILKSSFSYLGYEIRKRQHQEDNPLFHVYKYSRPDGSFDYEEYRRIQTEGNRRKIEWVWAVEENIAFLADYIRRIVKRLRSGSATARAGEKSRNGSENISDVR
jgi:hypothetical protein